MGTEQKLHWVVTREVRHDDTVVSEGMMVPGDVDPEQPWDELECAAVSTWGSRPSSPDETSAGAKRGTSKSERDLLDEMLLQFGWERSHGPRGAHYFPVRPATPAFHAERVGTSLVVTSADGVPVAEYELDAQHEATVLEQNGWLVTDAGRDAADERYSVRPFDWPRVVRYVSQARKSAQARAEQADLGWREVIREGLLAGQDARKLADLTGVTPQRIYQVRDGRR
jgi:hypothetical protein